MKEPPNHTGQVDQCGDCWVRDDDVPGRYGNWWQVLDGPGWDEQVRGGLGTPRRWFEVEEDFGPLVEASPERTAAALELVRAAVVS
ncbi:hypothetical protein ABT369_38980 [Dactylosporangium sp. NPDC000244]|uniref:hypothetical protein n=1 Tax=Dactylosporangium sp. NPDC000244 TaxID=3154365 RepID=UPI003332CEE9